MTGRHFHSGPPGELAATIAATTPGADDDDVHVAYSVFNRWFPDKVSWACTLCRGNWQADTYAEANADARAHAAKVKFKDVFGNPIPEMGPPWARDEETP